MDCIILDSQLPDNGSPTASPKFRYTFEKEADTEGVWKFTLFSFFAGDVSRPVFIVARNRSAFSYFDPFVLSVYYVIAGAGFKNFGAVFFLNGLSITADYRQIRKSSFFGIIFGNKETESVADYHLSGGIGGVLRYQSEVERSVFRIVEQIRDIGNVNILRRIRFSRILRAVVIPRKRSGRGLSAQR